MRIFFGKLRGDGAARPARAGAQSILLAAIGGFIAIGSLAALTAHLEVALLLGSFGASCVLIFGFPDAPFAQPINVIGGHIISTAIGLALLHWCGPQPWSLGIAVGGAIAAMMITRTVHPPAGSNPVIVFLTQAGWGFLLYPVLVGAILLVLIALVFNNIVRKHRYPKYW